MSEKSSIARAASTMSVATFISRVLGFVRDMITAKLFGATGLADAFFSAYRIPNLFRELFAEGSMSSAFIPVLTETSVKKGDEEANRLVKVMFTFIIVAVGIFIVLGILAAPLLVKLIAPGFLDDPGKFGQTVLLTRIMFPFLLMVSLAALVMGALNTRKTFFFPALASAWYNVTVIVIILLLYTQFENPIIALAIGVTIGGLIQFASQIPSFYRKGYRLGIDAHFSHPGLRQIGILIVPATLGMAVNQINIVVNNIFASFLSAGSITYLYYAMRLIQFPVGIFGVAMSVAALPALSRHAAQGDINALRDDFSFTLRMLFFITIPAMAGLISLSGPIVNLLFQRGKFDYSATLNTASALIFYSLGIWSMVGAKTTASAFYSMKDTKTPFRIFIIAVITNIAFSFLLMRPLQHSGLALANTISSAVNFLLLLFFLRRKIQRVDTKNIVRSFLKTALCAGIMGMTGYFMLRGDLWTTNGYIARKSFFVAAAIVVCLGVYWVTSYLLKSEELRMLTGIVRKKLIAEKEGS